MNSAGVVEKVVAFCLQSGAPINVFTVVVTGATGLLVLWLWHSALEEEEWAKYFGIGLLVLCGMGVARAIVSLITTHAPDVAPGVAVVNQVLMICGSAINNVFFLGAARALVGTTPRLPRWAWLLAALTAIPEPLLPSMLWRRVPDAFFSAYVMLTLSRAMAANLRSSSRLRSHVLVGLLWAIGLSFAVVLFGLSAVPWLARTLPAEVPGWASVMPVDETVRLLYFESPFAIAASFCKLGLFVVAAALLIRAMVVFSPRSKNEFRRIADERVLFLQPQDVILARLIGESLAASSAAFCVRLPGHDTPHVRWLRWNAPDPQGEMDAHAVTEREPRPDESVVGRVLKTGIPEICKDKRKLPSGSHPDAMTWVGDLGSYVAMPIRYHGATIGCLTVGWDRAQGFSETAVRRIRQLTLLFAFSIEQLRELAAFDQLGSRLAKGALASAVGTRASNLQMCAETIQDVLWPSAVLLVKDVGFSCSVFETRSRGGLEAPVPQSDHEDARRADLTREQSREGDDATTQSSSHRTVLDAWAARRDYAFYSQDLRIGTLTVGSAHVLYPRNQQAGDFPSTAVHEFLVAAASSLVAESILNAERAHLSAVLTHFQQELGTLNRNDPELWFRKVHEGLREAGAAWAAAVFPGATRAMGPDAVLQHLRAHPAMTNTTGSTEPSPEATLTPTDVVLGAKRIVSVRLARTGVRLWIGVQRAAFGPELSTDYPWRTFLERLLVSADAALLQITAAQGLYEAELESLRRHGLAERAVVVGTLAHQLGNMSADISSAAINLREAVDCGEITAPDHLKYRIHGLARSSHAMSDLVGALRGVHNLSEQRPCRLDDAIRRAREMFDASATSCGLEIDVLGLDSTVVDVPYHVATLAVANLLSNAKDAFLSESERDGRRVPGHIRIVTSVSREHTFCDVMNDGPEIPESLRDHIFEFGVSTKPNSGGWGLYLTRRSLRETGADIFLAPADDEQFRTRFTIRFPSAKEKNDVRQECTDH